MLGCFGMLQGYRGFILQRRRLREDQGLCITMIVMLWPKSEPVRRYIFPVAPGCCIARGSSLSFAAQRKLIIEWAPAAAAVGLTLGIVVYWGWGSLDSGRKRNESPEAEHFRRRHRIRVLFPPHVMDLMGYEGECRRRTEVIEWLLFFQANRSLTL